MARNYTAEELIQTIRDRGGFNDAETEGTQDADIIDRINEESLTSLYNAAMQVHREYYVVTTLQTLSPSTVRYRVPPRAMYQKVRDVYYRDGSVRYALPRFTRERLEDFALSSGVGQPSAYYMEGNSIVLLPDVGSSFSGQLEVSYFFRPGELVLSTECRKVSAVNLVTKTVTTESNYPATWSTSTVFDVHSNHSGAEIHAWDLTVASLPAANQITFTQAVDGSTAGTLPIEVGDYVCISESAALPGIPRELHPILAQAVKCSFMELRDPEAYAISRGELDKSLAKALRLMEERTDGSPDVASLRGSILWAGKGASY